MMCNLTESNCGLRGSESKVERVKVFATQAHSESVVYIAKNIHSMISMITRCQPQAPSLRINYGSAVGVFRLQDASVTCHVMSVNTRVARSSTRPKSQIA